MLGLAARFREISFQKLRHGVNKRLGRVPEFPALIRFFLFYGCNLRCRMCGQWGETGISKKEEAREFLPLEILERLLDEAERYKPEVYIWGGEPTLHPRFIEFVGSVKRRGLVCTVNTNGTMLEKQWKALLETHVDSLDVSLMGTRDVHDCIAGVPGAFDRVVRGLEAMAGKGKKGPLVKAIITLTSENLESIEDLLLELEGIPSVHMSIIQLGWFVTEERGMAYEGRMRNEFGIEARSWKGFLAEGPEAMGEKVRSLAARIRGSGSLRKPVLFFPDISPEKVPEYYASHSSLFGRKKCNAVNRELDIRTNGDVVVCADYPDYVVGNVYSQTIKEIWKGERLSRFRKSLAEKGLLPVCSRCCGLFR